MNALDWIILALGILAVLIYLTFQLIKFKKEKKNPEGDKIIDEE